MATETFISRLKNAWNAFTDNDRYISRGYDPNIGQSSSMRPDRVRLVKGNDRSIVTAINNRIAMDVASVDIKHVKLNENDRFIETIDSGLNNCLTMEANIDQTGRALIQDLVLTMFDDGVAAVVPIDTKQNPRLTNSYDITSMRVCKIVEWYPRHVKVHAYNDKNGKYEDLTLPKSMVAIIQNPLFAVMNEPNSTVQRLINKTRLMDIVDEESSANKLDLIIQLPYIIKTEARKQQAEARRKEIEMQLAGSKYGIAYTDGTERITQLNRSLENNLLKQVEYLTDLAFSQLGMTKEIMNGTANEQVMINYNNRTIEPILTAIVEEFRRKFLTKTARTQRQTIMFFKDPFKLVPVNQVAEMADKFTRNEIMTSNEFRQIIGMKPSDDPNADQLRNKNLNQSAEELAAQGMEGPQEGATEYAPGYGPEDEGNSVGQIQNDSSTQELLRKMGLG